MDNEILQGTVKAVVFQNYENGYTVLKLDCGESQPVTVVGIIPLPTTGERLMVTGRWSTHSSYGRQFEAEFLERLLPQTENEILSYLSSRTIKGIGPVTAARIVKKFGANTLRIIELEPHRLAEVSGISAAKAQAIAETYRSQIGMRQLMEFFALHQLPPELAVKTYRAYGDSSVDLVTEDPYILMDKGMDAPFGAVDRFAIELGFSGDDHRRLAAGILFEMNYNLSAGHTFLPEDKLAAATAQLLSVKEAAIREGISRLTEGELLVRDRLAGIDILYLPEMYTAERSVSARLLRQAKQRFAPPALLQSYLNRIAQESALDYSEQQAQAIGDAASSSLLLITGGPGTGKTTIVNGVLSLYERMGLRCLLAAPTGRAAKRLTEVTGREASTIHRLLEATVDPNTGNMYFVRDEENPLKTDVLIVDEMSMVDIQLMHHLLQALPERSRLILVGDPDQLPPVGPGFPFSDMLRSNALPSVRLTQIFRQAQKSLIVTNAHRVNRGELPELRDVKNDFFFLPARTEEEISQIIAGLCSHRLPKNMGIAPDQIQVLSPTKKGASGTIHLNRVLQSVLNPPAPARQERQVGDTLFREGDRVMQIRNNYDIIWKKADGSQEGTGVFNGDIGLIQQINVSEELMTVAFDDRIVEYDFTQLNELEPAYAMTVHKSQGSEYRAVIISAWSGSQYLLNRSVLYTAITRARDLLIIVGRQETIAAMTDNAKTNRRYSGLKLRLQEKTDEK